ncbi:MAG: lytic transglycosylase domain-containing protein [Paracoccaceae bacterium]
MTFDVSRRAVLSLGLGLAALASTAACARRAPPAASRSFVASGNTPEMNALIGRYAREYDMPESLLHRMIRRESGYNPAARNGPYYGLLQIHPQTARTMGFTGQPADLLDAETNLKYAGKYLRGAWLVSDGSEARAEKWYANGYYYEAKRRGLLEKTGLK